MAVSSDYAEDFNNRIEKFADELTKSKQRSGFPNALNDFVNDPNHTHDDVNAFFRTNQRFIDESTGNQQVKDDLLKLSALSREKFNDPNLAHLIASKAIAVMPLPANMNFYILPEELQGVIFSHVGATDSLNPLLVSKQMIKNVSQAKNNWISDNNVSLKELGCKTAKEAVQYVIDHQLTSANLSAFPDFDDEDLVKLCICKVLKKLSLTSFHFSGDKLVEELKKLDNLESLSLAKCTQINSDQLTAILTKHTNLQWIDLTRLDLGDSGVKAIVDLSNLRSLNLGQCLKMTEDQIAEILEKHTHIQNLDLTWLKIGNDRLVKAIVNLSDLHSLHIERCSTPDQIAEILEKHINLKNLDLDSKTVNARMLDAIINLDSLDHLKLGRNFTDDQIANILKKHTRLQSLDLSISTPAMNETGKAIRDLNLQKLHATWLLLRFMPGKYPNLQVLEYSPGFGKISEIDKNINKFPNLRHLYIPKCRVHGDNDWQTRFFNDKDAKKLKKKYPNLEILF